MVISNFRTVDTIKFATMSRRKVEDSDLLVVTPL